MELPSERDATDTDEFNWGSIPDEVDSIREIEIEERASKTLDDRSKNSDSVSIKHSNTIELSKKWESIDMNSIFASESVSNQSNSKKLEDDKDIFENCKELNNTAVQLIKEGIKFQELDEEEDENDNSSEENLQKAFSWFNKAKLYLGHSLEIIENNEISFDPTQAIAVYYNIAWVYQKLSNLKKWSEFLEKCLKLMTALTSENNSIELHKIRNLTKLHLQQWAVMSQQDRHVEALENGKLSVKHCQTLIYRSYKLCK